MIRFVIRRVAIGILTIWAVSVLTFIVIQLPPGDYVSSYIDSLAAVGQTASQAQIEVIRREFSLDQPLPVQYLDWIGGVVQGDLKRSLVYQRPVTEVIGDALPLTIVVSLAALVIVYIVALPIGILSAVRQYSIADYAATFVSMLGVAIPEFLLALVVLYLAFAWFHVDVGGLFSAEYINAPWSPNKFMNLLGHLPVPALILAVHSIGASVRVMRANLLDELRRPYVVTARAKGLSEARLILKYPVRLALNPFVSTIGFLVPAVVGGSIILSIVLNLQTLGPVLLTSLRQQDMFLAGAIVLMLGTLTVIGTLISDVLLAWLDPRIRLTQS